MPQCDRACEQVARCWAGASLYEIAANSTLSMVPRMVRKTKCRWGRIERHGGDRPPAIKLIFALSTEIIAAALENRVEPRVCCPSKVRPRQRYHSVRCGMLRPRLHVGSAR